MPKRYRGEPLLWVNSHLDFQAERDALVSQIVRCRAAREEPFPITGSGRVEALRNINNRVVLTTTGRFITVPKTGIQ